MSATSMGPGDPGASETIRVKAPRWEIPMTVGIILLAGGAFALGIAMITSLLSMIFLGAALLTVGVLEVVSVFRVRHSELGVIHLLGGALAIIVGAFFLYRPLEGLESLTLLVAAYLFGSGLFRGITAWVDRYPRWRWDLAYALVAVALGALVVANWPQSSLWVVGTVVAAEIIARGATLVAAAWTLRDLQHPGRPRRLAMP